MFPSWRIKWIITTMDRGEDTGVVDANGQSLAYVYCQGE
jgi:hypothetical protein